jgi:CRISPR-associated protein Cmr4
MERLCVVHDDVLGFLLETATEVVARIVLEDESKTVRTGGLWYEESLPAESILVGILSGQPIEKTGTTPEKVHDFVSKLVMKPLQFGGSATVGRGICNLCLAGN